MTNAELMHRIREARKRVEAMTGRGRKGGLVATGMRAEDFERLAVEAGATLAELEAERLRRIRAR